MICNQYNNLQICNSNDYKYIKITAKKESTYCYKEM